jgi:hypothetical protein
VGGGGAAGIPDIMVEVLKEIRAESFGRFPICGDLSRDSWRSLEISGDLWRFAVNHEEIDRFSDDSQKFR